MSFAILVILVNIFNYLKILIFEKCMKKVLTAVKELHLYKN